MMKKHLMHMLLTTFATDPGCFHVYPRANVIPKGRPWLQISFGLIFTHQALREIVLERPKGQKNRGSAQYLPTKKDPTSKNHHTWYLMYILYLRFLLHSILILNWLERWSVNLTSPSHTFVSEINIVDSEIFTINMLVLERNNVYLRSY